MPKVRQLELNMGKINGKDKETGNMISRFNFYEEVLFKDTELGPLPEDWEVVRLGEVAKFSRGLSWGKDEETNNPLEGKLIISIPNIEDGRINFKSKYNHYITKKIPKDKKLRINDIIFVGSSGSVKNIGRNVLIEYLPFEEISFASFTFKATPDERKITPKFFYYLANSKWFKYEEYSKRAADGKYNFQLTNFIDKCQVPLPPLSEQKAIAEVLSTIQEAREKTEEVIKATKELKKSMMKHLFTYGPVSLDQVDKVKLKETEIGLIPEHWEVVKLGDLTNNNLQPKEEQLAKIRSLKSLKYIPFIPMSLIPDDLTYINKWEFKLKEEIRSGIPIFEGDLLLAKITPCFENGKQGIIKGLPDGIGYATTEVIPLRLKKNMVSTEYLSYYLRFPPIRSYLTSKMEGTTGRKRLPKSQLENLSIPLPPLSEQQTISNILQTIDEKIQREEEREKALENLFKSMLHNLMSGKIRVKILEAEVL